MKNEVTDSVTREQRITRTSIIGIGVNALLAGFKATVGVVAGSVAIILDAVNNLTDALSSVLTIVGVKLARRTPDSMHPFGYGRVEYFSAVSIAALVLAAGAGSLVESVRKIVHPETPEYGAATLIIVAVAVFVKLALGRYVSAQGYACNSEALVASGADASFDAFISASTLVGAITLITTGINLDGWIGAAISLFILKAGMEMLLGSVGNIMGRRPDALLTQPIRETIMNIDGVLGVHDLILHNYGPDVAIGSVHVEVAATLTAAEVHYITHAVQKAVMDNHRIVLTVGVYAIDPSREDERTRIEQVALNHDGVVGVHGIVFDDKNAVVYFDLLVDFTVRNRSALREEIQTELAASFPGKTLEIGIDTNYSD